MIAATQLTEAEVRALRDRVFGEASTDNNWEACKHLWMRPDQIAWLLAQPPHKNI